MHVFAWSHKKQRWIGLAASSAFRSHDVVHETQKSCQVQESSTDTCSGHVERLMRYTLRSVGVYARHLRSNENARASNSGKFPLSSGDVGRTISRFKVGCWCSMSTAISVVAEERFVLRLLCLDCCFGMSAACAFVLWGCSGCIRQTICAGPWRAHASGMLLGSESAAGRVMIARLQVGKKAFAQEAVTLSRSRTIRRDEHVADVHIADVTELRCSLKSWISSTLTWSVGRRRWSGISVGQRSRFFFFENKQQNVFDSESRSDLNFTGVPPCRRTPR